MRANLALLVAAAHATQNISTETRDVVNSWMMTLEGDILTLKLTSTLKDTEWFSYPYWPGDIKQVFALTNVPTVIGQRFGAIEEAELEYGEFLEI